MIKNDFFCFFVIFQAAGNREKKIIIIMKKNGADLEGLLPKSYCEKKFFLLYCKVGLYCSLGSLEG